MRELKSVPIINKMMLAFFDYSKHCKLLKDKKAISKFILFYKEHFSRYERIYREMIRKSHQRFIKRCEERGFSYMAKDFGLSRQAIRKRYLAYGGKKIFRNKKEKK